ncbi:hypothetical protein BGX21_005949, partial [Mortierella sp. AD011]
MSDPFSTSTSRRQLNEDGDQEYDEERRRERDEFLSYKARREREIQEESQDEDDENDLNDESSVDDTTTQNGSDGPSTSTGRKTPFRGFTARSDHSVALLKAMLFKSPFDKKNGATIPERWQGVVNVLFEGGEQLKTIGGKNV